MLGNGTGACEWVVTYCQSLIERVNLKQINVSKSFDRSVGARQLRVLLTDKNGTPSGLNGIELGHCIVGLYTISIKRW